MKIGNILKDNKLEVHKKSNKKRKRRRGKNLSFSDFQNMMKHDSYKRVGGAIRQVRHK